MSIQGKGVVVTGAGHGIGRAIAARLATEGARVVVNDLDAAATAAVAEDIGGYAVAGDAGSEAGVADLVERAQGHLGNIDVWFANAGTEGGVGLDAPEAEWAGALDVNLLGHVRAARRLVPGWVDRGQGRFVVTASAAGLLTMLGSPVYSVTKHGAVAFAEWLSATYRHRGVVVQTICPLGVRTRMYEASGAFQELLNLSDVVSPDELAETVWRAMQDDRFYILPHPEVADYYVGRAGDPERWLRGRTSCGRVWSRKASARDGAAAPGSSCPTHRDLRPSPTSSAPRPSAWPAVDMGTVICL
ncbi:SDR family oxidoreductase [Actinomadura madurae]|uniref:SDR family oxidoreductase n=1 Tax=Actinomadura madurae TaxID=1993 RepID=UPI00399BFD56